MDLDDIVYISLLIACIGVGHFYRQIRDKDKKKWAGTGVGLLIVLCVSGLHVWHTLLTFLVNAAIILLLPKRQSHLVSFAFSFLYLLFFRTTIYFGIAYPPAHTNLVQMMLTLKLVGLAFEVNSAYLLKQRKEEGKRTLEERLEDESSYIDPGFVEIVHYTFNYIGVLTGPYYRYRTFRDFFELPFTHSVAWNEETLKKLTYVPLYCALFLWGTYTWPLSYAVSEEFYNDCSWLYRLWYVWPNFFIFRMRIYIGLVLSECVCTMTGLGAYPVRTAPKAGMGPSKNFEEMKEIAASPARLANEKYDFETIHNIDPYGADFCTTFREGMKNWNICIQYWLAVYIYKRFPDKKLRTTATMLVSAFWHGMYSGHYVCIGLVPFYLALEDVYVKLFLKDNTGLSLKIWEWIIWFFKMFGFSYLGIAFHLLVLPDIIRYYNSIYYCGFVVGIVLYLIGRQMLKAKRAKSKGRPGEDKQEVRQPVQ